MQYDRRNSTLIDPASSPRKHFSPPISLGDGDIPICYDNDDDQDDSHDDSGAHGTLWKGRQCFSR